MSDTTTPPTFEPLHFPIGGVSRLKKVLIVTDTPKSTWYHLMEKGRAPKPCGYQGKTPYWSNDEVLAAFAPHTGQVWS